MEIKKRRVLVTLFFLVLCFILFINPVPAAEPVKILISPFNIHSKDDLSFLNTGIIDMLSARLAKKDRVVIIKPPDTWPSEGDLAEETAVKLATDLKADYVIIGSLTVFGNSISTHAKFIEVKKNEALVTSNQYGEHRGDALSHVNLFAEGIHRHLSGGKEVVLPPPVQKEEKPTPPQSPPPMVKPVEKPAEKQVSPAKAKTSPGIWKSRKFDKKINSMAIGDVDGDGNNETVFISKNELFIYRVENGSLVKKAELKGKGYHTFLYVDVADINNNQKAEIFVTSLSGKGQLNSFILEYDGLKFKKIVPGANFYYRVLSIPGRGNILLGQKRGMLGTGGDYEIDPSGSLFLSGVVELKWKNKGYEPADRLELPDRVNIYSFAYGNVLNDGREMTVVFTKDNRLVILDKTGNEEFKSRERYGGSAAYLEFPVKGENKQMDRFYLPQRIFITDFDQDGKNEIVTVRTQATTSSIFKRYRNFDSGWIECLTWNNVTLKQKWKTDEISGYISDLAVGDMDNDGISEIVFPVITQSGSIIKKKRSHIIAWENPE
ncbi:MAG: VCBS repeat-containing protein [Thermodesulfobacteriota bacterium]|nr:VCBS repeat-containing protein [Thermodesulfobacteriota bacterium]